MDTNVADGSPTSQARCKFTPKPDITAYELAQIFEAVLYSQSAVFMPDLMALLPAESKRHFTDLPDTIQKDNFLTLLGL